MDGHEECLSEAIVAFGSKPASTGGPRSLLLSGVNPTNFGRMSAVRAQADAIHGAPVRLDVAMNGLNLSDNASF